MAGGCTGTICINIYKISRSRRNVCSLENSIFCKTLNGAEVHRGNNFSDLNVDKNIKMVVTPKSKLTQAFDIGESKYGSDEVIYGATQKFEVLKKGFEIVTNPDGRRHRQYVIYLKEL